jgi:hypothetical protein
VYRKCGGRHMRRRTREEPIGASSHAAAPSTMPREAGIVQSSRFAELWQML